MIHAKSKSISIRAATQRDLPQMVSVINSAFAVETFLEGDRTNLSQLADLMEKGMFLLAHDHSGTLIASIHVESRGDRGYFGMLAVDPACQGKGIGRAMVEAAEEYCRKRKCRDMDLTVLSVRPELPPLYRRLGYAETGTEEFRPSRPLKNGIECHCIVMSKKL
jgi:ribosomal protein S18 acetylase RimI-like enzyme